MWNKITRFCTINTKAKFISLLIAIVVWVAVKEGGIEREKKQDVEYGDAYLVAP